MSNTYEATLRSEILDFIPENSENILEIGCGRSLIAREIKKKQRCVITGIEPDPSMAQEATEWRDKVLVQTVEQALANMPEKYDCVLMIDVLEHLVNPWQTVAQLKNCLSPDGCLVASIPNMRYYHALKGLILRREWEYDKSGVKDITHLRFFTESSIRNLFASQGYTVQSLIGINEIRLPWKWRQLRLLFPNLLYDIGYPQFVCVATLPR